MKVFRKVIEDISDAVKAVNKQGLTPMDQIGKAGRVFNVWTNENATKTIIEQNDAETTYQCLYFLNGYFDVEEFTPENMADVDDLCDRVQASMHTLEGGDADDGKIDAYWAKELSTTNEAGSEARDQPHILASVSIEVHLIKSRL